MEKHSPAEDSGGKLGQGPRGSGEFCQQLMLRNGVDRLRSAQPEAYLNGGFQRRFAAFQSHVQFEVKQIDMLIGNLEFCDIHMKHVLHHGP